MARVEVASGQESVHVERIDRALAEVQTRFDLVVANLLKRAPNTVESKYRTRFNNEFPTHKRVSFDFKTAKVTASYDVDSGTSPSYDLRITTPITIDGLNPADFHDIHHPLDPHEIVTFRSRPYHTSFDIEARAVTRLGDFGYKLVVAEYTAGGLLPPIKTLGREKLQTIEAVTSLFRGVTPINAVYLQPFRP